MSRSSLPECSTALVCSAGAACQTRGTTLEPIGGEGREREGRGGEGRGGEGREGDHTVKYSCDVTVGGVCPQQVRQVSQLAWCTLPSQCRRVRGLRGTCMIHGRGSVSGEASTLNVCSSRVDWK